LPEFNGEGRERGTVQHLLTHVSGLPDQLPNNAQLRKNHASLSVFVAEAMRVPLGFAPGTKYEYSSMAILLATEIAQRLSGKNFLQLVDETVFGPLQMTRSAIGLGGLKADSIVKVQTEHAAPEAGGGDPSAKDWDWNSDYWRALGAPWGGVHSSAGDIARFLDAFVNYNEKFLSAETARLMIRNHNPDNVVPRGLGFALGPSISKNCSKLAFGHTGSTGTIAWLDVKRETGCVILTSLPGQAVKPHPRELAAEAL
jgi:CubicO group peptidase (beta-lactamase class C family)